MLTFVKICASTSKETIEKLGVSLNEGSAPTVADVAGVAQKAADIAKCVTIIGSLFQVVVVVATLFDLGLEMNRASKELPLMKKKVENLRESIVMSIIPVLYPNGRVEDLLMKDMFRVQ